MRRLFAAYGSGELREAQLRNFIRNSLSHEPQLGQEYIALTDACLRAKLISPRLQSNIRADILELTSPSHDHTMVQPVAGRAWHDERAANATDVQLPEVPGAVQHTQVSAPVTREPVTREPVAREPAVSQPRSGSTSGTGSSWNLEEADGQPGVALYPGAVLRDRFVLVEVLGHGGMGVVYKAYDRRRGEVSDRYVAIKVLSEEFKRHPLAVKALQREARKAQKLAHPNIVAVHDFDRDAGNVFMVMEWLSGRSLDRVLRDDGQGGIPLGPAMDIIRSLGAALSYAHEHGIVHSDFKPSNAFMGTDGRVKVLDFGIARAAPTQAEKREVTLFDPGQLGAVSPSYASFERLQGVEPDIRDDVYSFACVVYELLTGLHPYQRIDAVKAFEAKLEPRPVRKLSRSQWRALKQGLALRRADRCPTIDSLVYPLLTSKSQSGPWIVGAAAVAAVAALAGVLVWQGEAVKSTAAGLIAEAQRKYAEVFPDTPRKAADVSRNDEADAQPGSASPAVTADQSQPPADAGAGVAKSTDSSAPGTATARPVGSTVAPPVASTSPPTSGTTPSHEVKAATVDTATVATAADDTAVGDQAMPAPSLESASDSKRRMELDLLKEQFENQAIAGDVQEAGKSAGVLSHAAPGSAYVQSEVPRVMALAYQRRARNQFDAGQVNEALQTLTDGRRRFTRSTDLRTQQETYTAAADLWDHLSTAISLPVEATSARLDELKQAQGEQFDGTARMLAQTLANRIADQRAAGRAAVADKLLQAGRELFPDQAALLTQGEAGKLAATPIEVTAQ